MPRRYEMTGRSAAMQRTREAILDAAVELFAPAWYDEVTLADIAREAGVSQQTVVNHFGSKAALYRTGISERFAPAVVDVRGSIASGDAAAVVAAVMRDYEATGLATWRMLVIADREPELADIVEGGRNWHRSWVEASFAPQLARHRGARRERMLTALAVALDVSTWKSLRHDRRLGADETTAHLRLLVEGALSAGDR